MLPAETPDAGGSEFAQYAGLVRDKLAGLGYQPVVEDETDGDEIVLRRTFRLGVTTHRALGLDGARLVDD